MSTWIHRETGPKCHCGWPTTTVLADDEGFELFCLGHTKSAGAVFPLPSERPKNWPHLSAEELDAVMEAGQVHYDALHPEEGEHNA